MNSGEYLDQISRGDVGYVDAVDFPNLAVDVRQFQVFDPLEIPQAGFVGDQVGPRTMQKISCINSSAKLRNMSNSSVAASSIRFPLNGPLEMILPGSLILSGHRTVRMSDASCAFAPPFFASSLSHAQRIRLQELYRHRSAKRAFPLR